MSHRRDWREEAACRAHDPELFFPPGLSDAHRIQVLHAIEVCRRCPVATPCLAEALEASPCDGIWAGTTPSERRRLSRGSKRRQWDAWKDDRKPQDRDLARETADV